jgi:hypothetical protein
MDFMGKSTKFNKLENHHFSWVNQLSSTKFNYFDWNIFNSKLLEMNFIPHLDRKTGVSGVRGVPEAFSEAASGQGFSEGVDLAESTGGAPDFLEVPT